MHVLGRAAGKGNWDDCSQLPEGEPDPRRQSIALLSAPLGRGAAVCLAALVPPAGCPLGISC